MKSFADRTNPFVLMLDWSCPRIPGHGLFAM
jgi:hypothetical protein